VPPDFTNPRPDLLDLYLVPTERLTPKEETLENGKYLPVWMDRPGWIVALDATAAGTIYVYPGANAPSLDRQAIPFPNGWAPLGGRGRFWVKHSGASPQAFQIRFDGIPGDPASSPITSLPSNLNLKQINGTDQTPMDLTGQAFLDPTWGNDVAVAYGAADASLVIANPLRRALSLYNESGAQTVAVSVKNPMTAVRGFVVLPPLANVIWNPPDRVTKQALRCYGTGNGNIIIVEGT